MKQGLRQSMAWLHTWSGLIAGWVAYFVFVTGTIGYFYFEIDRWMRPELPIRRHAIPAPQFLAKAEDYLRRAASRADTWTIHLPGGRPEGANYSDIRWRRVAGSEHGPPVDHRLMFDPQVDGFCERHARLTGGGHLLYRMHWQLHYMPRSTGPLVVGACSMIMLVALVSGVITHKRIVADLFTFRPGKGQRSWLDAHTAASVLALPFFVMITYSGLVFFANTYVPIAGVVVDADDAQPSTRGEVERAARKAPLLRLEYFRAAAARYWGEDRVRTIQVLNPGDVDAEVHLVHNGKAVLLRDVGEELHFSGVDGHLIREETARRSAVRYVQSALFGLHEGLFAGALLRWLYFLSGLVGCVMVASGLVLWTAKRRAGYAALGGWGHALVERLNIGTIAGLLVGVAAYFWANRLLPVNLPDRAAWEAHSMFIAWGFMLLYAAYRPPQRAWVEELAIAAGAFALLPLVNALTTQRHLGVTIPAGDWALAGVDLTMFGLGILLAVAAMKVRGRLRDANVVRRTGASVLQASPEAH